MRHIIQTDVGKVQNCPKITIWWPFCLCQLEGQKLKTKHRPQAFGTRSRVSSLFHLTPVTVTLKRHPENYKCFPCMWSCPVATAFLI